MSKDPLIRVDCPHCSQYVYMSSAKYEPSLFAIGFPQKGRTVYQGSAPARILDSITEVPEIPEAMAYDAMAKWLLGAPEAWQRPLDKDRIEEIGSFWAAEENFVVNPAILGLRPDIDVQVEESQHTPLQVFRIKMSNWFVSECPLGHADDEARWFDKCPEHDCKYHSDKTISPRPLQIIDGQHRIRGTQSGPSPLEKNPSTGLLYADEALAFVLLRSDEMDSFDLQAQAKIFTEITTKGEELYPNHKAYLMYRFAQRGEVKAFDRVDMRPGHPDHSAYETCLRIISPDYGNTNVNPWRKKVPPMRGTKGVPKVASLPFLFSKIRQLFRPGRHFEGVQPFDAAKVVVAFGQAIVIGWDRPSPSMQHYWYPPKTPQPKILEKSGIISSSGGGENTTWLRILFDLFDDLITKTGVSQPTRQQLLEAMGPILHCSFDGKGWDQIPGREANENYMSGLLRDVIMNPAGGLVASEMQANACSDLNDYVAREPLLPPPQISGSNPDGDLPEVSEEFEVEISVPMNMLGPLRVFVVQDGAPTEVEIKKPKRGGAESIRFVAGEHYERTGKTITLNIEARNPVGEARQQLEVKPDVVG